MGEACSCRCCSGLSHIGMRQLSARSAEFSSGCWCKRDSRLGVCRCWCFSVSSCIWLSQLPARSAELTGMEWAAHLVTLSDRQCAPFLPLSMHGRTRHGLAMRTRF